MVGKFRNKPVKVKEIGIDELGQPTVNGNPILKFRLPKLMQWVTWVMEMNFVY